MHLKGMSLSLSQCFFLFFFFKPWSIYWFLLNVCLWTFRHFLTILHKGAMQLSIITFLFSFLVFLLHLGKVMRLSAYAFPPYMFAFPWNEHTILADYVRLTSVFVPYCHWPEANDGERMVERERKRGREEGGEGREGRCPSIAKSNKNKQKQEFIRIQILSVS